MNPFSVQRSVRGPWRRYLDQLTEYRPALHAYCCRLTGNVWDGEDLVQDTLVRVFSLLGKTDATLENPKAYLIRTASNLWIDRVRRSAREQEALALEQPEPAQAPRDPVDGRPAAAAIFQILHPQERAAILMREVFELSLEETAAMLAHDRRRREVGSQPRTWTTRRAKTIGRLRRAAARGGRAVHARADRAGHDRDESALRRERLRRTRRRRRDGFVRQGEDVLRARAHGDAEARVRHEAVVDGGGVRGRADGARLPDARRDRGAQRNPSPRGRRRPHRPGPDLLLLSRDAGGGRRIARLQGAAPAA